MPRSISRNLLLLFAILAPVDTLHAQMEHVVFISSTGHGIAPGAVHDPNGNNFGGQGAADFLCTERAFAAGLLPDWNGQDKVWRALISTTDVFANQRIEMIGRAVNRHGDVLANSHADFWDGTISAAINYDEFGNLLPSNTVFWSGSISTGAASSQNALNWSSSSSGQLSTVGRSGATINWLNAAQLAASQGLRLPCMCEAQVINPGDYNDDGFVDALDYTVWRNTLGDSVGRGYFADGDGDTLITLADFQVWKARFGTHYPPLSGVAAAVPEPTSLALSILSTLIVYLSAIRFHGRRRVGQAVRSPHKLRALLLLLSIVVLHLSRFIGSTAQAAITLTGDTSPVYDDSDPWLPGSMTIGDSAPGSLTIDSESVVNSSGGATIADSLAASSSTASVVGNNSKWKLLGPLRVGHRGTGSLDIENGGIVESSDGLVANDPDGNGHVTVDKGTWTNFGSLNVAFLGFGSIDITGGGNVSSLSAIIGAGPGGNGTVTVGGGDGQSIWTNTLALTVGRGGVGKLDITGGGTVLNSFGSIASSAIGEGAVNVGGGTGSSAWINSQDLRVGYEGTGSLNVTEGGNVTNTIGYIGFGPESDGAVTVGNDLGSAVWTNSRYMYVGYKGVATLDIAGNGSVSSLGAYIGYDSGAHGEVNVGGGVGAATWTNPFLFVGYNYSGADSGTTGILNILDYGLVSNIDGYIGAVAGSTGIVNIGGGAGTANWNTLRTLYVGMNGTGTLNIDSGGTVTAAAIAGGNANSSINFDGGSLTITGNDAAANTIKLLSAGGVFHIPDSDVIFEITSAISGTGGLVKEGAGTLRLSNANIYEGDTSVQQGTLLLTNAAGSATGTGVVTIESGGILSGDGMIAGNVVSEGIVAPGLVNGEINIAGSYTQVAAGTLQIGIASGNALDRLTVGGMATLAGKLLVSLTENYMPESGAQFNILDFGSRNGEFSSLILPPLDPFLVWDVSQLYTHGILSVNSAGAAAAQYLGNDNARDNLPVPEPTTIALALIAIAIHRYRTRYES